MSFFNLLSSVVAAKINHKGEVNMSKTRTLTPLNLTQDSLVRMDGPEVALAQVDGSIIPNVVGEQRVIAVGKQTIFGLTVYHSYLSDGKSFIRTIVKNDKPTEVTLFSLRDEIVPSSKEDWEFWLGRYQKDSSGNFVRDSLTGKAIIAEYGLIGWQQFQVDGPPQIVYNRSWLPSSEGIEPIEYDEEINTGLEGGTSYVHHDSMEYVRLIGEDTSKTTELLLVSMLQMNNEASINIFVGINLNSEDIKVLASQ